MELNSVGVNRGQACSTLAVQLPVGDTDEVGDTLGTGAHSLQLVPAYRGTFLMLIVLCVVVGSLHPLSLCNYVLYKIALIF